MRSGRAGVRMSRVSTPGDREPREAERVEHHPPPTVLLYFTFFTGLGLVIAGTWLLHGNIGITVVGAFGLVVGLGGLLYTRGHM
jgi:hypothetical protein